MVMLCKLYQNALLNKTMTNIMVEQYYNDHCYLMGAYEVDQDPVDRLISNFHKDKLPRLDGSVGL